MITTSDVQKAESRVSFGYGNAICQYINVLPREELKRTLIQVLRQEHAYRYKQETSKPTKTRGKIADMLSIEEHRTEVEDRIVPVHWESDLILGKNKQSALGTLVERTTRYTFFVLLGDKKVTHL